MRRRRQDHEVIEVRQGPDAEAMLRASEIHVIVESWSPQAYESVRAAEAAADTTNVEEEDVQAEATPELPTLRLRYRNKSDFSRNASARLSARLVEVRSQLLAGVVRVVADLRWVGRVTARLVLLPDARPVVGTDGGGMS